MRRVFTYLPKKLRVALIIAGTIMGFGMFLLLIKTPPGRPSAVDLKPQPPVRQNKTFQPDNTVLPKQPTAPVVSKIDTKQPVVFLSLDDGQQKDDRAVDFLKQRQWPVTLFLTDKYASENYNYFKKIEQNGASIQNHTLSHVFLNDLTYNQQKSEICGASDKANQVYGKRPTLLRPPGGFYDNNTQLAAYECGIGAVVMWSAKVDGGNVQFQQGDHLVPGDIVLMHFRPKIMEDLAAFEAEIIKQGLYVARLEDWIRIEP
ncbi:MAG TPA: polysaccharide deacetylase family protein [Candidatus Limnocylindrales bacterium]|nr:polysaccharide deacetylase family protein [Candidatus Limnocylindrales bacterium]